MIIDKLPCSFCRRPSLFLHAPDEVQNLSEVGAVLAACAYHLGNPIPRCIIPQPFNIVSGPWQVNLVGNNGVRPLGEPRPVLLQLEPQRLELLHWVWLAEVDDVDEADAALDVP